MKHRLSGLLVIGGLAWASLAHADVAPPDTYDCAQVADAVGRACADNPNLGAPKNGTCQKSKCTENDYSHWDRDSGKPPPTTDRDCNRCIPTGGSSSASSSGGGTATGGDGGASPAPAADDGGCNVADRGALRNVGPWLLALTVPALLFVAKRRRERQRREP